VKKKVWLKIYISLASHELTELYHFYMLKRIILTNSSFATFTTVMIEVEVFLLVTSFINFFII